jgi:peroxiredoxin
VRRNALVFIALVMAIMAMLAFGKYARQERKHGPIKLVGNVQGVRAPDFTLTSLDGSKVKLSDFRGKAVLLNFWATWCPPCKVEMPWFEDLQKQYGKDGLVVLGVAMDDSEPASIAKFASEMGVNYPLLLGTDQVSDDYGDVQYLPTTFYIARDGTIVDKMTGLLERKDIEDAVRKTLNAGAHPVSGQQNQARAANKAAAMKALEAKEPGRDELSAEGNTDR